MKTQSPARNDLLHAVAAWSHKDDWGVPVISVDMVLELVEALDAGVDPFVLTLHAKHTSTNCCRLYRSGPGTGKGLTLAEAWEASK